MKYDMVVICPDCNYPNDFSEPDRWKDDFKDDSCPTVVDCYMCGNSFWVQPVLKISLELCNEEDDL